MGINFAIERRKFHETQEKLRREYEAAGMTPEQILAMYEADLKQFNRDIAYYRHTQTLSTYSEDFEEETQSSLLKKNADALTVVQEPSLDEKFRWIDEIEDETLSRNLKLLSEEEIELIDKLAFGGYTQKELSVEYGKSPAAICLKLKTIRKKLKKSE